MRRYLSMILAIILLVMPTTVPAETGTGQEEGIYSLATAGGKVYAIREGRLAVYDPDKGSFEPASRTVPMNTMLADSPDGLYLFHPGEAAVIRLEEQEPFDELERWNLSSFPDGEYDTIYRAAVTGNVLYLLTSSDTSESFRGIIACGLKDNRMTECPVPATLDMTCAWDGAIAVYSTPLLGDYCLYSWNTGEKEEWLQNVPGTAFDICGGLAWHEPSRTVYVQAGNVLYSYDGETLENAAYMQDEEWNDIQAAAIPDGKLYMQKYGDGMLKKFPVTEGNDRILRIAGQMNDMSLISAYRAEHPDITVIRTPEDPDAGLSFAEQVLNGNLSADLIVTSTSSSLYRSLISRGYVLPMDSSGALKKLLELTYPHMAAQVTRDGHCYGLPVDITAEPMGVHPELFEEAGLDVPHTVEELLLFARSAALPDNMVMWNDVLCTFSERLLQETMDVAFAKGMETDLGTVRKLLGLWEQYDAEWHGEDDSSYGKSLFTRYCNVIPGKDNMLAGNADCFLLAPAGEMEPAIPASMQVVLIYARTEQPELCLDFVSFCAEHLPEATRIVLLPDCNEPVADKEKEEEIRRLEEELSAVNEALEKEPGSEALRLKREEDTRSIQELLENPWEISPKDIEAYRKTAPYFVFSERRWQYDTDDHQIFQLREQLRKHQMSTDAFVDRYEELMRMITLENE